MQIEGLKETNFLFENQTNFYKGKVRDVYSFGTKLVMITTDRISAFDVVLPRPIPYKGQILNQIAFSFLNQTKDIVANWSVSSPDPSVTIGRKCVPFEVEMVVRGYLAGHAWREYKSGKRIVCGVTLPDGLKESQKLPQPIITPTTKASEGHDLDISREEILKQELVSEEFYTQLEQKSLALFERGTQIAAKQGLILVDTKYEFGHIDGKVFLMDEVHTPDSSRYYYIDGYQKRLDNNEPQKQLSKEFVREWLMENGFQGKDGQIVPEMTDEVVFNISNRYIELYEKVMGETFVKRDYKQVVDTIYQNILKAI